MRTRLGLMCFAMLVSACSDTDAHLADAAVAFGICGPTCKSTADCCDTTVDCSGFSPGSWTCMSVGP